MVTKRGTNAYHGSAYGFYFATNVGAANSWANNHTPSGGLAYTPLPSNHRNRFGGSLGGVLLPKLLGGKTYFFVNYEGSRFPNVGTLRAPVALRAVARRRHPGGRRRRQVPGVQPQSRPRHRRMASPISPRSAAASLCDPRGIGLNPVIPKIWQYMPMPTDFTGAAGDGANVGGYISTVRAPLTQNSYVARIDHDFNEKNRFFATYRYSTITSLTTNQVDIGGLAGGTLGQPVATAPRVQKPSYWVLGLTSSITPTITNDFRLNYSRNSGSGS